MKLYIIECWTMDGYIELHSIYKSKGLAEQALELLKKKRASYSFFEVNEYETEDE